jgi:hypothetical protein
MKLAEKNPENMDSHDKAVVKFIKSYRPVTTTQRASYAYQDDQAKSYMKIDFLKQNMPLIIGGIFIILVLAIFMMFFGKVVEPVIDAQSYSIEYEKLKLEELQVMQQILTGVQEIKGGLNMTNEGVPNE